MLIKYLQSQQMNQITIINILQKIRSICKQGNVNEKIFNDEKSLNLQEYLKTLDSIRLEFIKFKNLEEEYNKLQNLLQRQETQIRKRIGVEQQLKLYTEALKIQVEELEKQKLELLENSKAYIKQLKKNNQQLYAQLYQSNQNNKKKSKESSPQKAEKFKVNKSLSHNKSKHDKSIRQIVKTEYIERDRSNSAKKKKSKSKKYGAFSTIGHDVIDNIQQNSKTFHVVNTNSSKKPINTGSKKKGNHLFSNNTLLNFLENSNKKLKKQQKNTYRVNKSPLKHKKKQGTKSRIQNINKYIWKDKKANKSIFSVSSLQKNSNKKQTI